MVSHARIAHAKTKEHGLPCPSSARGGRTPGFVFSERKGARQTGGPRTVSYEFVNGIIHAAGAKIKGGGPNLRSAYRACRGKSAGASGLPTAGGKVQRNGQYRTWLALCFFPSSVVKEVRVTLT